MHERFGRRDFFDKSEKFGEATLTDVCREKEIERERERGRELQNTHSLETCELYQNRYRTYTHT